MRIIAVGSRAPLSADEGPALEEGYVDEAEVAEELRVEQAAQSSELTQDSAATVQVAEAPAATAAAAKASEEGLETLPDHEVRAESPGVVQQTPPNDAAEVPAEVVPKKKTPPPRRKRAGRPPPPASQKRTRPGRHVQRRPWWEEVFSEEFARANRKQTAQQIKREVDFIEHSLGVAPGGAMLDLACGSGRHAVELAGRGYHVVGYDLSVFQLALASDAAQEKAQQINFLQGDMRQLSFEDTFDGIICWNTSFGYFEEDKNIEVAERIFKALRPGGMLLLDVANRDYAAANTPCQVWFEGDSCVCMDDVSIDYITSRLRVKRSVIMDDGRTRECQYSLRLYALHELGRLLHEVGFRVAEASGHIATPGVFFGETSPRIIILAQRP